MKAEIERAERAVSEGTRAETARSVDREEYFRRALDAIAHGPAGEQADDWHDLAERLKAYAKRALSDVEIDCPRRPTAQDRAPYASVLTRSDDTRFVAKDDDGGYRAVGAARETPEEAAADIMRWHAEEQRRESPTRIDWSTVPSAEVMRSVAAAPVIYGPWTEHGDSWIRWEMFPGPSYKGSSVHVQPCVPSSLGWGVSYRDKYRNGFGTSGEAQDVGDAWLREAGCRLDGGAAPCAREEDRACGGGDSGAGGEASTSGDTPRPSLARSTESTSGDAPTAGSVAHSSSNEREEP